MDVVSNNKKLSNCFETWNSWTSLACVYWFLLCKSCRQPCPNLLVLNFVKILITVKPQVINSIQQLYENTNTETCDTFPGQMAMRSAEIKLLQRIWLSSSFHWCWVPCQFPTGPADIVAWVKITINLLTTYYHIIGIVIKQRCQKIFIFSFLISYIQWNLYYI